MLHVWSHICLLKQRTIITTNYERESVFAGQKELQQRCTELEKMVEDQQQGNLVYILLLHLLTIKKLYKQWTRSGPDLRLL